MKYALSVTQPSLNSTIQFIHSSVDVILTRVDDQGQINMNLSFSVTAEIDNNAASILLTVTEYYDKKEISRRYHRNGNKKLFEEIK